MRLRSGVREIGGRFEGAMVPADEEVELEERLELGPMMGADAVVKPEDGRWRAYASAASSSSSSCSVSRMYRTEL